MQKGHYFMTGQARKSRQVNEHGQRNGSGKGRSLLFYALTVIFTVFFGLLGYCYTISDEVPSLKLIENPDLGLKTIIYSRNNEPIGEIYQSNRTNVTFDQLPEHLIQALVATEDRNFYEHSGIDVLGFTRAVFKTVINKLSAGKLFVQQGGGTITMQTARLLYTGRAGTIKRKLLEMMIALQLERTYSKREVLEIFFNTMFYGHRSYGIVTAAKTYFNKSVEELTADESAILVGLLQRPSQTNPITSAEDSFVRRNMVLNFMAIQGYLDIATRDSLKAKPVTVVRGETKRVAAYFRERLNYELTELGKVYGFNPETDGLQVYTTLDTTVQMAMDSAIYGRLPDIQTQSFNSSKTQELRNRYLNDSTYVSKAQADSAFKANHVVQYGFITIDHKRGEVLGHLGGLPGYYYDHVFNGRRQPGSLIKPFVYATAIDNGYTAATKVLDAPYVIIEDSVRWHPENWDGMTRGLVTLRYGLTHSINLAVLNLQDLIGGPRPVRELMLKMGFTTTIKAVPSLPLGVNVVRPIELVAAYGAFANRGTLVENHTIQRILDKHGNVIYTAQPKRKEVLNEKTAYIIQNMMESVVNNGSAARIRSVSNVPYSIHVAGKTGTTNDHTDIWTAAYTPRFTTVIWLGLDNPKHKINLWSTASVPIVGDFIKRVYDANPNWEHQEFPRPEGIEEREICAENDSLFLANPECPSKYTEIFRVEFAPTEQCKLHTSQNKRTKRNYF